MSAWPLQSDATVAVEAAAKKAYEDHVTEARGKMGQYIFPEWDDLDAVQKLQIREAVLPIVWAALSALPDPRKMAWEEGYVGGYSDGGFDSAGSGPYEYAQNPY